MIGFNLGDSAQYDEAVKLLEERYDDQEFIIHSLYELLTNLIKCSNITADLRKTFNTVETHLRSLQSLGETVENKHLVSLIKTKFPREINLKLEETREGDGEWTVAALRS